MRKILLVEDDDLQLGIREAVLRGAGFDVITATGAEDALAALMSPADSDSSIGLIITDHYLAGLTGAEFVREVRKLDADVPIVVLSGALDAEHEYAGLNITFRQKPCPPTEMISLAQRSFHRAA